MPVSGPGTFTGTFEGPLGGYDLRARFASDATTIDIARSLQLADDAELREYQALITERLNTRSATPDGMSEELEVGGMRPQIVDVANLPTSYLGKVGHPTATTWLAANAREKVRRRRHRRSRAAAPVRARETRCR